MIQTFHQTKSDPVLFRKQLQYTSIHPTLLNYNFKQRTFSLNNDTAKLHWDFMDRNM